MSWQSFRLAAAYVAPVVIVVAVWTWPVGIRSAIAVTTALVGWQVLLLRSHLRTARCARRDLLTGLPDRTVLLERMRRALDGPAEVGLVFVDLDRFKAINDTYGHVTGDRVLVETARRLCQMVPARSVVARYGGDEFAILVPPGPTPVGTIARRIEAALSEPVWLDAASTVVVISASVGTATSVRGSVDEILAAADQVMYQAKRRSTDMRTSVPNGETQLVLP
jgi:diguanylate cyclase (GGDEF)-like protein